MTTISSFSLRGSGNNIRGCPSGYYQSFVTLDFVANGQNQSQIIQSCDNSPALLDSIHSFELAMGLGFGIPACLLLFCLVCCGVHRLCPCQKRLYGKYPSLASKNSVVAVPLKPDNQVTFEALGPILHRQFLAGNLTTELINALNSMPSQQLESAYWTATQHSRDSIANHIRSILKARGFGGLHSSFETTPLASAPKL